MPSRVTGRYAFGEFVVDVRERRVWRGAAAVSLPPKAFDVLVVLLNRPGELMTKRELLAAAWPNAFVEEGILTVYISPLRRCLGTPGGATYIETVRRFGYRFAASVTASPKTDCER